ncbi:MAG: hypothetical protein IJT52_03790 [Spirochaetales bacterium]|nr:hypothetical protein [Spirochaetales bacterium]
MKEYPRIDDKVILQESFKGSPDYKEYFSDGRIDGMFGVVADVVGVRKSPYDGTIGFCDITTDSNIVFRVPLEFVEKVET